MISKGILVLRMTRNQVQLVRESCSFIYCATRLSSTFVLCSSYIISIIFSIIMCFLSESTCRMWWHHIISSPSSISIIVLGVAIVLTLSNVSSSAIISSPNVFSSISNVSVTKPGFSSVSICPASEIRSYFPFPGAPCKQNFHFLAPNPYPTLPGSCGKS